MMPSQTATVIGPLTKIRGEFAGTENLAIDGEVDGVIRLEKSCVTVRAEGRVRATIIAQDVIVLGHVEGEIRASGLVHLRSTAVVLGDVFTARLSIDEGAVLRGHTDPSKAIVIPPTPPPVAIVAEAPERSQPLAANEAKLETASNA